ncbi:MAG TPA: PIN domain-containing protein [Allosphingosinicella sp.]|jgi:hypothetical protein
MILADTSVWIDHFRCSVPRFGGLVCEGEVLMHPFVLGELMLSGLHRRLNDMRDLEALPAAAVASSAEVAHFIRARSLDGRGIGYVDAALLSSALLSPGTRLMTHDKGLSRVAAELGVAAEQAGP